MNKIPNTYFPIFEWTEPKTAIMGGFSLDKEKMNCQHQYLSYLEKLSQFIKVIYFANDEHKKEIQSQINCSKINFVNYELNSIWIRDYAPIWLQCRKSSAFLLANFPYGANHFGKNEQDDGFSSILSEFVDMPLRLDFPRKQIPYYFDGGNIFVDEDLNCFTAIRKDDPPEEYRRKLLSNINCNKVVIMDAIPGEGTGHVDTFMKILPNKIALLAKYNLPDFNHEMSKNKMKLTDLGYDVFEIKHSDVEGQTNWSYLNSA